MSPQIVLGYPPNIEQIAEKFPHVWTTAGVLFAYGDTVYNPDGISIPEFLAAHEEVHLVDQHGGAEEWWTSYIKDEEFRYSRELLAHRMEMQYRLRGVKDRNQAYRILTQTAVRLVAPLYGYSNRHLKAAVSALAN